MTIAVEQEVALLAEGFARLKEAVRSAFLGHEEVLESCLYAVLAGGHVLLEGAPGLGKTTLVRGLARALELDFRRIQFTPDLLPPDVLGARVLEEDEAGRRTFRFDPGPIFTHVLLADEINRATPRTQSALLEAMQEGQVTLFGESRRLSEPFCVVATQNPVEMEGTYPLPEAQLDRFLVKLELAPPSEAELTRILAATTGDGESEPVPAAVVSRAQLLAMRRLVRQVPVHSDVVRQAARIVCALQPDHPTAPERVARFVRWGASPRGGQALLLLGKARALVAGRVHVTAGDVEAMSRPALRHRLILGYEGEASGVHPDELIGEACARASRPA